MRSALAIGLTTFPGATAALRALADLTGDAHVVALPADARSAAQRFAIDLLAERGCRRLILAGWSRRYEPFLRDAARRRLSVAAYWTSSAAQTGLAGELPRLNALLDDERVAHVWLADRALADALRTRDRRCAWMPVVPDVRGEAHRRRPRRADDGSWHVGLFCSPLEYGRKNVLVSLLAAAAIGDRCRLHVNGLTTNAEYRRVVGRLHLDVVEHGWMSRDAYLRALSEIDLGLQISLAESYALAAAEHLLAGVAVVVSPMVPAIVDLPTPIARPFVASRPDDPAAIGRVATTLLSQPARTRRVVTRARRALVAGTRGRAARVRRLFTEMI